MSLGNVIVLWCLVLSQNLYVSVGFSVHHRILYRSVPFELITSLLCINKIEKYSYGTLSLPLGSRSGSSLMAKIYFEQIVMG